MTRRLWLLPLLLCLAGCPGAYPGYPSGAMPTPSPADLASLVQQSQAENAQLAQNLNTPLTLNFPVRLGVLFFDYDTVLEPEDQQTLLDGLQADLTGSGLVRSMVVVPSGLVTPGDNLDAIRQLVSRFRIDTLLIVSGTDTFQRSKSQPGGFFNQFSNAADYEADTSLTALGMDVLSGRFLAPLTAVGHAGPQNLNPDDSAYPAAAYALKKHAASDALTSVEQSFKAALQALHGPSATASATAMPSAAPSASATVAPSPVPSAAAS